MAVDNIIHRIPPFDTNKSRGEISPPLLLPQHAPSTSAQVYVDRPLNVCMKEKRKKEFNIVEQIFRTRA